MVPASAFPSGLRPLVLRRTVLSLRCPQCGQGRIFRRWARPWERCAVCGLVFRREPGAMTGSMYATAVVTELFAALLIAIGWICTDWSAAVFVAVAAPLVALFSALLLPRCQAFWIGVEYCTDVHNGEPWARPRT